MKIEVKKIDALRRELRFEIPKERVLKQMEEVYAEIGKVAKVKGFRPGKVPRSVLEAEHADLAREETLKKLIPEVYQEGIQKEKITPMDMPDIENVEFKDGSITFTAKIDIKPEIKIKNYKGIKVVKKNSLVTEEEINKAMEYFKKGQGQNKEIVVDDQLARGLGYPDLVSFKQALAKQMEIDKDRQSRIEIENQIVEALMKEVKVSVPQNVINKHLQHRLQEAKQRLKERGLSEGEIKKKEEELNQNLEKQVERDIKIYLIFEEIAELEEIKINEGESLSHKVLEFLLRHADWQTG